MRKWLMGPVVGAGLVGAAIGVGLSALSAFAVPNGAAEKRAETFRQLELFAEIVAKAQSNYVIEFDESEAIEAAIDGMLSSLAKSAGVGVPETASALSSLLPKVVDGISPGGKAPEGNDLGGLLASVGKLLG